MKKNSGDSTVKFLIYVLLFLIFILMILLLFIIPNIKSYKSNKSDLKNYTSQNKHLSQKQVKLSQDIESYKKEHSELLKSFSDDFNETHFLTYAKKYFSNVSLKENPTTDKKSQFKVYSFKATSLSKTPNDFYKFIDDLKQYDSIIKINFPITIISNKNNIDLSFNMSIFSQNN